MEINIHTDMALLDFTGYYLALIIQTAFFLFRNFIFSPSCIMLKNGKTHFKNLAVFTPRLAIF